MSDKNNGIETQPIATESLLLDCRPLGPFLVDLADGARVGMQSEQRGLSDVIKELVTNQKKPGENAGVAGEVAELIRINDLIAKLDEHLSPARKIVELIEESRAKLDDDRHRLISAIATVVEARAKLLEDESLLARYQKTRTYRSAKAMKAVKTRKRNADELTDTMDDVSEPSA